MIPPPEHVSHDSQPDICSILLMIVPAGAGVGLGDGVGFPPEGVGEGAGGGVGVGDGVDEVVPGEGAEFVAGAGVVVLVLSGAEAVPPHPATASKSVPDRQVFKSPGGKKRIS